MLPTLATWQIVIQLAKESRLEYFGHFLQNLNMPRLETLLPSLLVLLNTVFSPLRHHGMHIKYFII